MFFATQAFEQLLSGRLVEQSSNRLRRKYDELRDASYASRQSARAIVKQHHSRTGSSHRGSRRRPRADRPRCGRHAKLASSSSSRRSGVCGCHSPGTGPITAVGSSSPHLIRIVQRKRRPKCPPILVASKSIWSSLAVSNLLTRLRHRYSSSEDGFSLQLRVRKPSVPQRRSGECRCRSSEVRNLH
jgi:hypothetical protein